ncbi:phytoene desaturase family protein [Bythopirellula polymerisocia]|uniref:Pyridine nucleotide-disulfide oxidoreductase domain-containing protein 2 n=1 Tax=Bythopirellula polymerisocia TaxID=2528003 RepID=A0A5C6D2S0_9BACT|nr:NAD(P)/FAD-dependent oxidoreductase [Bythopirellula polymerisocia]TWU30154.1 zeta-carotene-forming phytoene desaturase [Bythopirellula polymerisocia]
MAKHGSYDCIIIGGGHNGLVTAAYLAKAGRKVCVLERRHVLGGCASTEELWPGYKVSTAAYVISLFQTQILRELRLKEYGLNILPRSPSSFTPLPDGRSLLMGPDAALNQREIGKFSMRDAAAYPRYEALLERVAATLEPVLGEAAPDPLPLPKSWRKIGIGKRLRDGKKVLDMHNAIKSLGADLPEAVELLTGAARPILERWFESDVLRATLATDAIIGAFTSISSPGSAYVLLHHVMGEAGGARGVWGYVQGGMGALSDAIAAACVDLGAEIRREAPVHAIHTDKHGTCGVGLEDGSQLSARVVASSVDAHLTFERLLAPDVLPEEFREAVARIDYSSASAKVNLALSEPPRFTCIPGDGVGPHHHGTMHIGPSLDYLERAYDDAKYGRPSEHPILECTMATSVDSSIAPPGKHILSMFVQFAPYKLVDGNWDDIKESFGDRCVETLAQYAPNIPSAIEHRQILTPLDLERTFGITGGNIMQGAMPMHQLYCFRPVAGWADHRTPVPGLYLCGAASHPGGGVMGACGRNAATEILRDKPW